MPACHNCGNTDEFVLLLEIAATYAPPARFAEHGLSLALECARCASTDVTGDPAALLALYAAP